jgi:hypothetical protein
MFNLEVIHDLYFIYVNLSVSLCLIIIITFRR